MTNQYNAPADVFVDGPLSESLLSHLMSVGDGPGAVGAQSIFLGRVRADLHDGRRVAILEYESYREMALPVLNQILSERCEAHRLSWLRVCHSIGRVKAGQLCFAVVACATHRDAARDGCSAAVERIKTEVPIFAKEFFEDGSHIWKRNT